MEDRYLFKAKRIDNGEWVQGAILFHDVDAATMFNQHPADGSLQGFEVDPSTICQCTGLKDKNDNMIWENDILQYQFDNEDCSLPNKDTKKRKGKVFFSDYRASFSIAMGRRGSKSLNNDLFKYVQCGNRVEVLGDTFDNPELLEVQE